MSDWLYQYPTLYPGKLLKRYKRFFADIELETGEVITAHCPNTGPMTGISTPGSLVQVSLSSDLKRKLPYTWELIQVADPWVDSDQPGPATWVGVNTAMPNRITRLALERHLLIELKDFTTIEREVKYGEGGQSRIDFRLLGAADQRPVYVEVKSTTWVQGDLALFPDTVTTRGQKHLHDLIGILPVARSVMLYFINRGDRTRFAPGDIADPTYGKLLREAVQKGVEVLPYRFEVTPIGIRYLGLAELCL
jgi:sugar fermentation stimulation protein A